MKMDFSVVTGVCFLEEIFDKGGYIVIYQFTKPHCQFSWSTKHSTQTSQIYTARHDSKLIHWHPGIIQWAADDLPPRGNKQGHGGSAVA